MSTDSGSHSAAVGSPPGTHSTRHRAAPNGSGAVHLRLRSDAQAVLVVPLADVRHLPPAFISKPGGGVVVSSTGTTGALDAAAAGPLFLCEAYAKVGLCRDGAACRDVHAVTTNGQRREPHRRVAVGNERTPRVGARGSWVIIARANEKFATLQIDASQCLATSACPEALPPAPWPSTPRGTRTTAPSVCAHFVKKSVCNFGAQCRFVHPLGQPKHFFLPTPQSAATPATAASATTPVTSPADAAIVPAGSDGGCCPPAPPSARRYQHNPYAASPGWSAASRRLLPAGSDA